MSRASLPSAPNTALRRNLLFSAFVLFIGLTLAYGIGSYWQSGLLFERKTYLLGRDFVNFWMAGQAAWQPSPERFYDFATYNHALQDWLGAGYVPQSWSYPPTLLPIAAPFGALPYFPALALWTVVGLVALIAALHRVLPRNALALVLLSPAAFACLLSGQSSLLTAALMMAIFRHGPARPVLGGLMLGLLSVKPQLGLLFPIWLLMTRQWRLFGWGCLWTGLLVGLTTWLYGVGLWEAYFHLGLPVQHTLLENPPPGIAAMMPTLFMEIKQLGAPYAVAMACQAAAAVGAVFLLWRAARYEPEEAWRWLAFTAASLLCTPYLMIYDLLPFTVAVVWVLSRYETPQKAENLWAMNYFLPAIRYGLGSLAIPGAALLPAALLVWATKRRT